MRMAATPPEVHHAVHTEPEPGRGMESPMSHQHAGTHCGMTCARFACEGAGHCVTPAVATNGACDVAAIRAHDRAPTGVREHPHSVSEAPEPPPPRA